MNKKRIGIIFGGKTPEHSVSVLSAASICKNLDASKYDIVLFPLTQNNKLIFSRAVPHDADIFQRKNITIEPGDTIVSLEKIKEFCDVCIPVIHGTYGEDGRLQGFLEMLDIPYTGSTVLGTAVGMDKILQNYIVEKYGVKKVKYISVQSQKFLRDPQMFIEKIQQELPLPVFIKPANAGSSIGISKVTAWEELLPAIEEAFRFDHRILAEEGLENFREIELAVLGNQNPDVSESFCEIKPDQDFYSYDAKYAADSHSEVCIPARIDEVTKQELISQAKTIFTALECRGYARVDFMLASNGEIYFNEVNTHPGCTSISAFAKMWASDGVLFPELLDRMIALAEEEFETKNTIHYSV
ncbi:D-alanine--D-alanine ligase A [Candidatus Peregrinibacteria bacterium]|nr:MAG: D-alanine--D-alanine ligase A [Candidatus Peregrinibacteria bacterium]